MRYEATLVMWQRGKITIFSELFKYIPVTRVALDMHIKPQRFAKCVENPRLLTSRDIDKLSDLYMLPRSVIKDLMWAQLNPPKGRQGRR